MPRHTERSPQRATEATETLRVELASLRVEEDRVNLESYPPTVQLLVISCAQEWLPTGRCNDLSTGEGDLCLHSIESNLLQGVRETVNRPLWPPPLRGYDRETGPRRNPLLTLLLPTLTDPDLQEQIGSELLRSLLHKSPDKPPQFLVAPFASRGEKPGGLTDDQLVGSRRQTLRCTPDHAEEGEGAIDTKPPALPELQTDTLAGSKAFGDRSGRTLSTLRQQTRFLLAQHYHTPQSVHPIKKAPNRKRSGAGRATHPLPHDGDRLDRSEGNIED